MMNLSSRKFVIRQLSFAFGLFAAACNSSNPAEPSPADSSGNTSAAATISQVLPASLSPSPSPQALRVEGTNFKPGLTVPFTFRAAENRAPAAERSAGRTTKSETFSGPAIQNLTETSFEIDVTVTEPGTYTLQVTNPDAPPSEPAIVEAEPDDSDDEQSSQPEIAGIDPVSPHAAVEAQTVYVEGAGFAEQLSVKLTRPNGETSTIADGITFASARLFRFKVVLKVPGRYSLRVVNPSGEASEPWVFEVGPEESETPEIKGLSPQSPTADSASQTLRIEGRHFEAGLKVILTGPGDDDSRTISGSAIKDGTPESFKLSVVLAEPGEYHLRVVNPDGKTSAPRGFLVTEPEGAGTPTISAVDPGSPTASSTAKPLWVLGTHFEAGLVVKLERPGDEGSITIGGSAIDFESSELFTMMVTLPVAGTYSIRVVNPSGGMSNWKTFTVKPGESSTPTVTRIEPEEPAASGESQPIWVVGTNFQEGLTVKLVRPGGSTQTISGEAIDLQSSTVVKVTMSLGDPGNYSLKVVNPGGQASGSLSFTVSAGESD